ncbi:MAG: OmpA family protein, partial [Giesbergeria sp.]|nr:OmpA family protein [Giesbergeria sp.]
MPMICNPRTTPILKASVLALAATLYLAGCATQPPATPDRPVALSDEALLDQGISYAVDDLIAQALRAPAFQPAPPPAAPAAALNALLKSPPKADKALVLLDRAVDGVTGQETGATREIDRRTLQRLTAGLPDHTVSAVDPQNSGKGHFLVTSTLSPVGNASGRNFVIKMSLTDLRSGIVIANAAARVRANGVDETPTQFFRESPAVSRDRTTDGQIRTASTSAGAQADALYISHLPIAALITEGEKRYEQGECKGAVQYFEEAAARPEGQLLKVFNGLYLCQTQLERTQAAETTFARIVALGLATNNLSVKFLFNPGSVDFIADPKISTAYTMWLRQIAKEAVAA